MHSYQLLIEIVMVKLMKMYIKLQAGKRFLFMFFLLFSVIGVHCTMMVFAKKDPQLGQIVSAKIQLLKKKIPRKLAA